MTAAMIFLMFWAALAIAGDTPFGRLLRRFMVDFPARIATRANVTIALVILALIILHLSAGEADPVRLLGLFAPDLAIWLVGFEISAIVDLAAGFAALAAWCWIGAKSALTTLIVRFWKRPKIRAKRARRRRDRVLPANDDEDGHEFALASQSHRASNDNERPGLRTRHARR